MDQKVKKGNKTPKQLILAWLNREFRRLLEEKGLNLKKWKACPHVENKKAIQHGRSNVNKKLRGWKLI